MNRVFDYLRRNSARVYAVVVAIMALVLHYLPDLPGDLALGIVAALLTLAAGEKVQRVENRKTDSAKTEGYIAGIRHG